jgi:hypothetical protein
MTAARTECRLRSRRSSPTADVNAKRAGATDGADVGCCRRACRDHRTAAQRAPGQRAIEHRLTAMLFAR